MRIVYFLRHCLPCFPDGKRLCLGNKTDLSLGSEGRKQASNLAKCFVGMKLGRIFSSPMKRCIETAELVFPVEAAEILQGTEELDCGGFEGLDYETIREKYPDIFAKRLADPTFPPPEGESYSSGAERFRKGIESALAESRGDIIIVCHGTLLNAFLSSLPDYIPQERKPSYGTVSAVSFEHGSLKFLFSGIDPESLPAENSEKSFYEAFKTPENVREHCKAVLGEATELYEEIEKCGIKLDIKLIKAAALLHDLHRTEHEHADKTADYFCRLGFLRLGNVIRLHHGGFDYSGFDEAKLVYLADKYVSGTKKVSIDERFSSSLGKCKTAEAFKAHDKRLEEAKQIEREYTETVRRKDEII